MEIMKISLIILIILIIKIKSEIKNEKLNYEFYLQINKKDFNNLNNIKRYETYLKNKQILINLQKKLKINNSTFYLSQNQFLDWYDEEINLMFSKIKLPLQENNTNNTNNEINNINHIDHIDTKIENKRLLQSSTEYSNYINWASSLNPLGENIMPSVQNQGKCGACWAFAATESTTASIRLNGYKEVMLSSQELLDCDIGFNSGCSGGNPAVAYEYIQNYGLTSASAIPYKGYEQTCYRSDIQGNDSSSSSFFTSYHQNKNNDKNNNGISLTKSSSITSQPKPIATISKYIILPSRNELMIKFYVRNLGPVSVGICGTDPHFVYYGGGIFDVPQCCTDMNHAVVIVGYGTDSLTGLNYWIAMNSWGTNWGENGFIRIVRSDSIYSKGQCGLALGASLPIGGKLLSSLPDNNQNNEDSSDSENNDQKNPSFLNWFNQIERWCLSNIKDLMYGISGFLLGISVLLFFCGLLSDIWNYFNDEKLPNAIHVDDCPIEQTNRYGEAIQAEPITYYETFNHNNTYSINNNRNNNRT